MKHAHATLQNVLLFLPEWPDYTQLLFRWLVTMLEETGYLHRHKHTHNSKDIAFLKLAPTFTHQSLPIKTQVHSNPYEEVLVCVLAFSIDVFVSCRSLWQSIRAVLPAHCSLSSHTDWPSNTAFQEGLPQHKQTTMILLNRTADQGHLCQSVCDENRVVTMQPAAGPTAWGQSSASNWDRHWTQSDYWERDTEAYCLGVHIVGLPYPNSTIILFRILFLLSASKNNSTQP